MNIPAYLTSYVKSLIIIITVTLICNICFLTLTLIVDCKLLVSLTSSWKRQIKFSSIALLLQYLSLIKLNLNYRFLYYKMMTNAAHAHANAMSKIVQFSSTKRPHRISTAFVVEITNTCNVNSIFLSYIILQFLRI